MLDGPADAPAAAEALRGGGALILERRIPFDRELSIIAVRGVDGDVRTWPLVENEHRGGILRTSRAPAAAVDDALQAVADGYVRAVLDHFDYVGVLTVELFQVGDRLLANEMAPRVHNSGHWTIEGARTSQFENHVRAVLGWPLGPTDAPTPSVMINCIGALPEPAAVLAVPGRPPAPVREGPPSGPQGRSCDRHRLRRRRAGRSGRRGPGRAPTRRRLIRPLRVDRDFDPSRFSASRRTADTGG